MAYKDDVKSISIERSLGNMPTASIEFATDPSLSIDDTIEIQLGWDDANTARFYGIVDTVSTPKSVSPERPVVIELISAFSKLADKPLNTELYAASTRGQDIMADCIIKYGGMPSDWVATPLEDNSTTFDEISMREKSVLEGIRKVAQACKVEVYTGVDGKMKTATYVDPDSYTPDHTLGTNVFSDIGIIESAQDVFTKVRVRGKYTKTVSKTLYSKARNRNFTGTVKRWIETLIVEDANPAHLEVTVTGDISPTVIIKNVRGQVVELELYLAGGAVGVKDYTITVIGVNVGIGHILSINKVHNNESFPLRTESVRSDATLISSHGIKEAAIDNRYIETSGLCDDIGDRFLKLQDVGRKKITVRLPFDSNIDLNEVIKFTGVDSYYWDIWVQAISETYTEEPLSLTQEVSGYIIGEGST